MNCCTICMLQAKAQRDAHPSEVGATPFEIETIAFLGNGLWLLLPCEIKQSVSPLKFLKGKPNVASMINVTIIYAGHSLQRLGS